jgi:hypothetical protein
MTTTMAITDSGPREVWRIGTGGPDAARSAVTAEAAARMLRDAWRVREERRAILGREMTAEEYRKTRDGMAELVIVIADDAAPWFADSAEAGKTRRILYATARSSRQYKIRFGVSLEFILGLPQEDHPLLGSGLRMHCAIRRPGADGQGAVP